MDDQSRDLLMSLSNKVDQLSRRESAIESQVEKYSEKFKDAESKLEKLKDQVDSNSGSGDSGGGFWLLFFLIAFATNPPKSSHVGNLAGKLLGESKNNFVIKGTVESFGNYMLSYDTYYVCSVVSFKSGTASVPLSFGIFGNVFDVDDGDKKLSEVKAAYESWGR